MLCDSSNYFIIYSQDDSIDVLEKWLKDILPLKEYHDIIKVKLTDTCVGLLSLFSPGHGEMSS